MLYPSIDPQTGKPLAWGVPPAYVTPGGSTYDQAQGFSPGDAGTDSQWWEPKPDPAAFDPRKISSSGSDGTGRSGQAEAPAADGRVTKSTGTLLSRGAPAQPPPGMNDGGQYQPVTQPQPQAAPSRVPPPTSNQPLIDETTARMASRQAPQMIGERPQDIDPQTGKEKTSAKLGSWGQRLAMAVLAATKLAPAAMQIVHPQYSEQLGQYQAGQKQDEATLKGLESGENTKWLAGQRQAKAAELQNQADPHYGMVQVDPTYAPAITPDANGQVWVPKAAATGLTKPDAAEKLHVVGDALVDSTGNVLYSGSKNPTSVFGLWIKQHPNGTAEDFQEFESHTQKQDDKEKFVQQYLKDGKLSDTSANRSAALKEYAVANQAPQRPEQPPQTMMIGPDDRAFVVRPGTVVPRGSQTASGVNSVSTPTAQMRNVGAQAALVHEQTPQVISELDRMKDKIGPVAGRWNEFMQGKIGLDDPDFASLRTDLLMYSSAVALMHARGRLPENLRLEFDHMINAPQQNVENLKATLRKVDDWTAKNMAAMGGQQAPTQGSALPGGITVDEINAELARRKGK